MYFSFSDNSMILSAIFSVQQRFFVAYFLLISCIVFSPDSILLIIPGASFLITRTSRMDLHLHSTFCCLSLWYCSSGKFAAWFVFLFPPCWMFAIFAAITARCDSLRCLRFKLSEIAKLRGSLPVYSCDLFQHQHLCTLSNGYDHLIFLHYTSRWLRGAHFFVCLYKFFVFVPFNKWKNIS